MSLSDLNDMKTVEVDDALTAKILAKVHHGAEEKSVVPMDDDERDENTHQFEEDFEEDQMRNISNKMLEKVKAKAQKQLKQLSDHPY